MPTKITHIEAVMFDRGDPYPASYTCARVMDILRRYGGDISQSQHLIALRIGTDTGVEGCFIGIPHGQSATDFEAALRPLLLGEDPFDRERLWMRMYRASVSPTIAAGVLESEIIRHRIILSAADIALWDLAGKYAGLPCWKLAGGCRDRVKVYISTHWDFGTPADYALHALECKKRGYHGIKVHGYYGYNPVVNIR